MSIDYWDVARKLLPLSNCLRRKYAAIIVKDGVIISTGYNKSLSGCTECGRESAEHGVGGYSDCRSIHAEQMTLLRAERELLPGSQLYLVCDRDVNPVPCGICWRMMQFAGVELVREGEE